MKTLRRIRPFIGHAIVIAALVSTIVRHHEFDSVFASAFTIVWVLIAGFWQWQSNEMTKISRSWREECAEWETTCKKQNALLDELIAEAEESKP